MTISSLEAFPDVCRLCLRQKPAPEMVPIHSVVTEYDVQLADLLDDFCAAAAPAEDSAAFLPSAVCEPCLQEFYAAYKFKRKINFLLDFQVAFAKMKQGELDPLLVLYDENHEYMSKQFQELELIEENRPIRWEDLVPELKEATLKHERDEKIAVILGDDSQTQIFQVELIQDETAESTVEQPADEIEIEYLDEGADIESKKTEDTDNDDLNQNNPLQLKEKKDELVFFEQHEIEHEEECDEYSVYKCASDGCEEEFDNKIDLIHHKKEVHHCSVCDICGMVLRNKYTLDVHVSRHKGETRFTCEYCPSTFYTAQEHKLHLGLVHVASDSVKCDVCGLEFKNATCLKRHMKSHSEIRSYKCPLCEKAFKTNMHLHRHKETIHHRVRFNCSYCDASYGRKDKLRMHIERAHDIQTYFLCEICLKSFSDDHQLQEHMGHHANPKPLECSVCLLAFLTQDEFDKHLCISYRDDYICCERDFKYHTFYNKHMFLVHGEKTNARVKPVSDKLIANVRAERKQEERCAKCDKVFASRKLKNAHKQTCLGKQEEIEYIVEPMSIDVSD